MQIDELPREPELASAVKQFQAFKGDTQDVLGRVNDAQVNWRRRPDEWSIGQCMEHLVLTCNEYKPTIQSTIDEGRAKGATGFGPFTHGKVMEWVIKNMEPPPRQKLKAPSRFRAGEQPLDIEAITLQIVQVQDEYCRLAREADGLDLASLKLSSPVTRLVRLTLGQTFRFLAAHQRRHLWQARQVAAATSFPA